MTQPSHEVRDADAALPLLALLLRQKGEIHGVDRRLVRLQPVPFGDGALLVLSSGISLPEPVEFLRQMIRRFLRRRAPPWGLWGFLLFFRFLFNYFLCSIFRVRLIRVREIDTRLLRSVIKNVADAAEFAAGLVILIPVAPEIAQLLQRVQRGLDRGLPVYADRGKAADREVPVFREAQAKAKQAQRFQRQPLVLENAVADPRERILPPDDLKSLVDVSSPLRGCRSTRKKCVCTGVSIFA